ncbi:MAG: 4-alpha-glucanotransferase [Simkaniaceae bacterium]|nr:4-alpha-glucanotransferase [Simkaniaceae bacterium]
MIDYPHHGVNLPLGALHSENSCGIGEFHDLIPLIDWCKEIDFDVIQLLPLNDSGFDPSPYNALSSTALNPIYITLHALGYKEKRSNNSTHVDYNGVLKMKLEWLYRYYKETFREDDSEYVRFLEFDSWLTPYAVYKALSDIYDFKPWTQWPKELQNPSHTQIRHLAKEHKDKVDFYKYLQFICHKQLSEVKAYANERHVFLKGDIPILISPESVDVWMTRGYFNLDYAAGAPPDVFNPEGQYWGFPLFNYRAMEEDDFGWWRQRLQFASQFYDIYRIDHIIGFFRIWAIERGKTALEGQFIPSEEWEYLAQGTQVLEMMLSATKMFPIGEDLGIIPTTVHKRLAELGICSTKVPRWERYWESDKTYVPLEKYPPLSLTTLSTHDSETLALWWIDYPKEAEEFCLFHNIPFEKELTIDTRSRLLEMAHHTPSLFHINLIGEYLALIPGYTWDEPKDERINEPGYVLPTNWTYRIRPSLEEFTANHSLADFIRRIRQDV